MKSDNIMKILSLISATLLMLVIYLGYLVLDKQDIVHTEIINQVENTSNVDVISDLANVDKKDNLELDDYINSLPKENLSQDEIDGLLLMREEEKLAHDVYNTLYIKWGQNIFNNIANSEQTHTDAVASLLNKYEIADPVITNEVGGFENDAMFDLYNELVEMGSVSIVDALRVGAIIEDLDIHDLRNLMSNTNNQDILVLYQNLEKGSRNHMRSFTRLLNRNGETYTAQYISEDEYLEIIATPSENGVTYDENGSILEILD